MPIGFSLTSNWGKEIHRGYDEFGAIRVFDDGNKLYLSFDSIHEQSCQHKAQPHRLMHEYTRAMLTPLVYHQPRHVTMLGLGGGSLLHCLHHGFPEIRFQMVELRPDIVSIARQIFRIPEDERVDIQVNDAGLFLAEAPASCTDFLLCDIYHAEGMDAQQAQFRFIRHCHRLLTDDGWIAINYSHHSECPPEVLSFIAGHFSNIRICTVSSGNRILTASKRALVLNEKEALLRGKALNDLLGYPLTKYLKRAKKIS